MKEKLIVVFDLNYRLAARDSTLRRKGFNVTLRTSYIPTLLLNTDVFICSINAALCRGCGSINMSSIREQWVCMSMRFYYGCIPLLQ